MAIHSTSTEVSSNFCAGSGPAEDPKNGVVPAGLGTIQRPKIHRISRSSFLEIMNIVLAEGERIMKVSYSMLISPEQRFTAKR
jgi:hypothetical protein